MIPGSPTNAGPPRWLVVVTAVLTLLILFMAVAETTLWTHYLIDQGEYISLAGLALILVVGIRLHRTGRLVGSLPLTLPWLIYPVVTQGDQIIDNLNINQMRAVCQVILAILFGAPIAVLVQVAVRFLGPQPDRPPRTRAWTFLFPGLRLIERGRTRDGAYLVILTLLLLEIWVAYAYLGELMVLTLIGMGFVVLFHAASRETPDPSRPSRSAMADRVALGCFLGAVALSFGLFLGFKNRPGAYQGSPHYLHDPSSHSDGIYPMDRLPAASSRPIPASAVDPVNEVLEDYGRALQGLLHAYYVMDRNYNYAFHNALFLRQTPVLPDFRAKSLAEIEKVRELAASADRRLESVASSLPPEDGFTEFLREIQSYVSFNLHRASILEEMSGRFERTQAGLQHSTHLYEGEGKVLGVSLGQILEKHRRSIEAQNLAGLAEFSRADQQIEKEYANRIVGF